MQQQAKTRLPFGPIPDQVVVCRAGPCELKETRFAGRFYLLLPLCIVEGPDEGKTVYERFMLLPHIRELGLPEYEEDLGDTDGRFYVVKVLTRDDRGSAYSTCRILRRIYLPYPG